MKTKLKTSDLVRAVIIILSVFMLRFDLLFFDTNSINLNAQRTIITIVIIIFAGISYAALIKNIIDRAKARTLLRYLRYYLPIIVLWWGYSEYKYRYGVKDMLVAALPYMYVLIALPALYVLLKEKEPLRLIKQLSYLELVLLILKFISWFTYNYTSSPVFLNFATEYLNWSRDGIQRVDGGVLFGLAYCYFLTAVFADNKVRIKEMIVPGAMYVFALVVIQSRTLYFTMLLTAAAGYFFTRKNKSTRRQVFVIAIVFMILILFSGRIIRFLEMFTVNSKYGYSTMARLETLNHFWDMFVNSFFIGIGYLENVETTASVFYRNAWSVYYLSDLGIISTLFRFGPAFIVVGVMLYKTVLKKLRIAVHRIKIEDNWIVISGVFLLTNSLFTGIHEQTSGFAIGIFLAMICAYRNKSNALQINI